MFLLKRLTLKNNKHDHWDIVECSYCREQEAPTDEGLHSEYVQLQGVVEELLASLEARKKLDEGFRGEGHDILVERASSFNGHVRVLKKLVAWKTNNDES